MLLRGAIPVLLSLGLICAPVQAEDLTGEKRADIERLLTMTGSLALGKQFATAFVTSITQNLRKSRPDIPQTALDLLPAEVAAAFDENADLLKEMIIPVYHKYFTAAEIREMVRFYSTPLGQKTIKVMPALLQDSMAVGQQWARLVEPQVSQRVTGRLRQQGIKI